MNRLRAGRAALLLTSMLFALALTGGVANAAIAEEAPFQDKVTFIGDSVTAGFGFCGPSESAKNISCKTNQEMSDRWYFGDNSLKDCAPPDPPALPNDACSNNNFNGKPWQQEPWKAGPNAPEIAYPFQLAARQTGTETAAVSDWAVTGSTPANWDPDEGEFGSLLNKLQNQYVGMTIGANPLLSYFTNINIAGLQQAGGPCVSSTGYKTPGHSVGGRHPVYISGRWYSGPLSNATDCIKREWNRIQQTQHLVAIYMKLLSQGDRVVVLGYYRDCSWSFGNWQPDANVSGPAAGNPCRDQKRRIGPDTTQELTQWEQAIAVGQELNNLIQEAVMKAKDQARQKWPGTNRDDNIVFTAPDATEWEQHQPKSPNGSWVLLTDTWIHPNKAGAGNLADTVAKAMCTRFGHWCGGDALRW